MKTGRPITKGGYLVDLCERAFGAGHRYRWAKAFGVSRSTLYWWFDHGVPCDKVLSVAQRLGVSENFIPTNDKERP